MNSKQLMEYGQLVVGWENADVNIVVAVYSREIAKRDAIIAAMQAEMAQMSKDLKVYDSLIPLIG